MSYLNKFYARRVEKRRRFIFMHMYKHLRQNVSRRSLWTWIWELLHATEALRFIDAACCTSSAEGGACDPNLYRGRSRVGKKGSVYATLLLYATLFQLKYNLRWYSRRVVTICGYYQTLNCSNSPCVRHKACSKGDYVPENRSDVYVVRTKIRGAGYQEGGG
jgi:hypothetical protein